MRVIDVDKVLKEFPIRLNHYDKENGNPHFVYGIETVMEYLDWISDEQKIDYAPVVHAHWITRNWGEPAMDLRDFSCMKSELKRARDDRVIDVSVDHQFSDSEIERCLMFIDRVLQN